MGGEMEIIVAMENRWKIGCNWIKLLLTVMEEQQKREGGGEGQEEDEKQEHKREGIDRMRQNGSMEGLSDWVHWLQSPHSWWPLSKAEDETNLITNRGDRH